MKRDCCIVGLERDVYIDTNLKGSRPHPRLIRVYLLLTVMNLIGDVKGKVTVMVDDMIDTADMFLALDKDMNRTLTKQELQEYAEGTLFVIFIERGFAFVYMDDERDAEYAIRGLDRIEFGRKGRRLRVEWTKQERGIRRPGNSRKSATNLRPSKTLFVINFDPYQEMSRDLERHFDPYGKISNIRIRKIDSWNMVTCKWQHLFQFGIPRGSVGWPLFNVGFRRVRNEPKIEAHSKQSSNIRCKILEKRFGQANIRSFANSSSAPVNFSAPSTAALMATMFTKFAKSVGK
ncbi:hypothetical protein F0562_027699 [Nyssa sinensis]|uniref:RRM domain-containing protein n=1 Tax=Nyssa sinensis TaxID=561372 RepID=A0A5J5BA73_9ASTE|nr:hypothetical protein F0562_027699 [Nyssa sinensis]